MCPSSAFMAVCSSCLACRFWGRGNWSLLLGTGQLILLPEGCAANSPLRGPGSMLDLHLERWTHGDLVPYISPDASLVWGLLLLHFKDDLPLWYDVCPFLGWLLCICPSRAAVAFRNHIYLSFFLKSLSLSLHCTSNRQPHSHKFMVYISICGPASKKQ